MNNELLDVLRYLFDHLSAHNIDVTDRIRADLDEAGFFPEEVETVSDWLAECQVGKQQLVRAPSQEAVRIYDAVEKQFIPTECQNHLYQLEQQGILTPSLRETVINQLWALADGSQEALTIKSLQTVIMLVLAHNNHPQALGQLQALYETANAHTVH